MSVTAEFYLARAAESAKAAEETDLANVRERCLRAEAAWQALANRLIAIETKKQQEALAKASRGAETSANLPWPIALTKWRQKPGG
ncbi:MAG: hypothetical protein EP321_01305 [Sphingomonadales bacterium]|nr:MAG: hypothetical protein EP345_06990 [Sphingomonadales bacterium]TNF06015.1 MAG: hypothetical protein EP321_01305 [Sphingomonadales bacterium]